MNNFRELKTRLKLQSLWKERDSRKMKRCSWNKISMKMRDNLNSRIRAAALDALCLH